MRARLPGQRQVVVDNPGFERRWRMNLGCDAHVVLLCVRERTPYLLAPDGVGQEVLGDDAQLWTENRKSKPVGKLDIAAKDCNGFVLRQWSIFVEASINPAGVAGGSEFVPLDQAMPLV